MDPSWVILTICEPWEIAPNEAPLAMVTVHAPDAPGSGLRSGGGGHCESQEVFQFFGHFRPAHSSFPPFLDPLNSFPWSFFADSSPFGGYNKNKISRRLDRVFRPPQLLLDQGNVTNEFLVSWAFHLYVVCKFWTSFG